MNTKTTLIVALVAVVVGAYVFLVEKPWEEPASRQEPTTTARLVFEPKLEDIERVELTCKGEEMLFARQDDDWMMLEPVEAPANKYEIDSIVSTVSDLKYLKAYEKGSRDRPDESLTGLGEPTATVRLSKGGQQVAHLLVGSRLPTGKGYYVRRGQSDTILETQGLEYKDLGKALAGKRSPEYRDKQIVRGKLKDVTRVRAEGLANFELVRSGDDWMIEWPTRGRADKNKADSVARQFAESLRAQDWEDDSVPDEHYGLDKPRLKVTMDMTIPPKAKPGDPDTQPADTQPSTRSCLLLVGGAKDLEGKSFFAKLEPGPGAFSLGEYAVKQLSPELSDLREKSLAKVDPAKATKMEAQTPGGSMTLTKQKEGYWTFADGTRTDLTSVEDTIKAVRDLKATTFTEPQELLIAMNWDRPRARISITQQGELNPITVLVGEETASGKMVYVRNAAEEAVAVVHEDAVAQLLLPPVSYRDRTVMNFPRDRATRIEITRSGAEDVVLTKAKNRWSLKSPIHAQADSTAARDLLQDLSSLRAKRVAGIGNPADFGLDAPAVTLAVHVEPLTADPNTKVAGKAKTATQPARQVSTQPAAEVTTTQPALDTAKMSPEETQRRIANLENLLQYQEDHPEEEKPELTRIMRDRLAALRSSTQPATQPAAKKPLDQVQRKIANLESLLQYQKDHPDEEKPELTKIIKDKLADLRASTQPAGEPAGPATQPASSPSVATRPAQTQPAAPPPPTIYRLLLRQRDGKTYARRDDAETIYELDSKVYEDATAEMHDRQIAKFEVGDVTEVRFKTSAGDIVLRKSGDDWKYAADPLLPIDKQKVTDALNAFRDLKTHRYAAYSARQKDLARYQLHKDVDQISVALQGGNRIEILLSKTGPANDPDKSRYAVLADSRKVFLLKGEQADKFAKKLEDFEKADSSSS